MFPARANGQSIHARTIITFVLPVRSNGQSIHAHTMMTFVFPVQCVRMARASMPKPKPPTLKLLIKPQPPQFKQLKTPGFKVFEFSGYTSSTLKPETRNL